MLMIKLFFFLRISKNITKLVIMILNVVIDLRMFLLFYIILLVMLSLILGVIGLGEKDADYIGKVLPNQEYKDVPKFMRNIFLILRYSFGDFEFASVKNLDPFESNFFWVTWTFIVLLTCIVFLNFIIAEVSQSYLKVVNHVNELICKERASLVSESEVMLSSRILENNNFFPKYLIIREVEV